MANETQKAEELAFSPALAAKFNAKFNETLAGHTPVPVPEHAVAMPLFGTPAKKITGNFCTIWPLVKGLIQMASSVFGWIPAWAGAAAGAAAFIAAFEATLLPTLCPVAVPPAE